MSPDAQRKAIATWCAWKFDEFGYAKIPGFPEEVWTDTIEDLNAMHDAAKALTAFQWEIYREELAEICTPLSQCHSKEQQFKFAMEATAPQRAEAFLRAIGKWVD